MRGIRLFFYFLWHGKRTYKKEVLRLMEFHPKGLAHHLSVYGKDVEYLQAEIDKIKVKHGYNSKSIAAEETFQVKRDAYKKLR